MFTYLTVQSHCLSPFPDNVVVPHPCQHTLCAGDWDPVSHTASTDISIVAAKDIIRDGNNHNSMLLSFEKLQPGGSGPYLDVFTGYSIPPAQVDGASLSWRVCRWRKLWREGLGGGGGGGGEAGPLGRRGLSDAAYIPETAVGGSWS